MAVRDIRQAKRDDEVSLEVFSERVTGDLEALNDKFRHGLAVNL